MHLGLLVMNNDSMNCSTSLISFCNLSVVTAELKHCARNILLSVYHTAPIMCLNFHRILSLTYFNTYQQGRMSNIRYLACIALHRCVMVTIHFLTMCHVIQWHTNSLSALICSENKVWFTCSFVEDLCGKFTFGAPSYSVLESAGCLEVDIVFHRKKPSQSKMKLAVCLP